jgi:hypothetical protein
MLGPYVYSFALHPGETVKEYDACYEWRKVLLRNELWAQLPPEIIECIAKECIKITFIPSLHQPSGSCNFSRIDNFELNMNWGAAYEPDIKRLYEEQQHPKNPDRPPDVEIGLNLFE